jgi:hypothetical protein
MKRSFQIFWVFLLITAAGAGIAAQEPGDQVIVGVRETAFRSSPSALGRVIAQLIYEEPLEVLEVRGDWLYCFRSEDEQEGWVHASAVVRPARGGLFSSSGRSVGSEATTEEVSLAGKGFNSEVEARYASEQNLSYDGVNQIENEYVFELESLIDFLQAGGLSTEGAAQ